jgi:hypothetical protein
MPSGFPNMTDLGLLDSSRIFISGVSVAPVSYNLTTAIVSDLQVKHDTYETDLGDSRDPSTRTPAVIRRKSGSKKILAAALRSAAALVQAGPNVTPEQKVSIGLKPRDVEPSPLGPPDELALSTLSPLGAARNELRIVSSATPTRRARPKNAIAAEVRIAVVDSPADIPGPDAAWPRSMVVTRAITEIESDESDAGKTLVVQSRWLGTRGRVGPWGPVETGTIAA